MSSNFCYLRSKYCFSANDLGQCTITSPCIDNNPQFITTPAPVENYLSVKFINICPKCGCKFDNNEEIIQNYAQIIRWYQKNSCCGYEEFIPHAICGNCGKEFSNPSNISKFCPDCGKEMIMDND